MQCESWGRVIDESQVLHGCKVRDKWSEGQSLYRRNKRDRIVHSVTPLASVHGVVFVARNVDVRIDNVTLIPTVVLQEWIFQTQVTFIVTIELTRLQQVRRRIRSNWNAPCASLAVQWLSVGRQC